ncbi:MAG: HDOD domain-containing protein, partial [Desulfovibrio sp.]|nr:HDOD domain-containing protein [Desulfovibrio sp.]
YPDANALVATSTVMLDGFAAMRPLLRGNQRFLINFTEEFLEAGLPAILPPEICVVEILETVNPTPAVIHGLINLKQQGYMLALDDYAGQPNLTPFLRMVDLIKIDVLAVKPLMLKRLAEGLLKHLPARLLAEKVEEQRMAALCRALGFSLFQGFFFSKAEFAPGAAIQNSQVSVTRMLTRSADPDMDLNGIKEMISSDIYLTYRLLKYINSVFFGLSMRVYTVDHAVALLGLQKIKQWLTATSMAGLNSSPMSQELAFMAAFRAKFLQILADNHPSAAQNKKRSSRLFLTGLFSILESLLQVPLKEILKSLPMDEQVSQVLTEGKGPLAPWYDLMLAYDKGNWNAIRANASKLSISDESLSKASAEAAGWSKMIFASL